MITIGTLNGKNSLTIPIMPSSFEVTTEQDHQTVNIVNFGEILLKGNRKLKSLTFSSFFPKQKYSFADTNDKNPYKLVKKIEKWKDNKTTLRVSTGCGVKLTCVIQSFNYSEQDGTKDVYYTITFTEYTKQKGKRAQKEVQKKEYTCVSGDNFYKVARKATGSTSNAEKIAKANKLKVSSKLKKGQKLVIKI